MAQCVVYIARRSAISRISIFQMSKNPRHAPRGCGVVHTLRAHTSAISRGAPAFCPACGTILIPCRPFLRPVGTHRAVLLHGFGNRQVVHFLFFIPLRLLYWMAWKVQLLGTALIPAGTFSDHPVQPEEFPAVDIEPSASGRDVSRYKPLLRRLGDIFPVYKF